MSQDEAKHILSQTIELSRSATGNLGELMGDVNVGGINREVEEDTDDLDEVKSEKVVLFSAKIILGIYDEEDLKNAYESIGVRRPEKWAKKMSTYVNLHR
jgi:hypothetical protein